MHIIADSAGVANTAKGRAWFPLVNARRRQDLRGREAVGAEPLETVAQSDRTAREVNLVPGAAD